MDFYINKNNKYKKSQSERKIHIPHINTLELTSILDILNKNIELYKKILEKGSNNDFNDYIIIEGLNLKICLFAYSFVLIAFHNEITLNPNKHNIAYHLNYCNRLFRAFCDLTGNQAIIKKTNLILAQKSWNISATIINSFLFKNSYWKIPMAILRVEPYKNIVHTIDLDGKNISLNVKNYKMFIGPIMSRLTGTENEINNPDTVIFAPILHAFLQGKTMNEIRILFPKEYQLISIKKKSMIYLHGKSCVIRPEDSNFFLDRLYDELKANKRLDNGLLDPNNDKLVVFGEKKENKKSKFMKPYFSRTVKCPCILTLLKENENTKKMNEVVVSCNRYIDFGQIISRNNFFKIFKLDNPLLGDIKENYEKVLFYLNPSIKNMQRITPTCSCGTTFNNLEGDNNYEGNNPLLRHPTDVQCPACNKKFCTDCKLTHDGILCNGMVPTLEGKYNWNYQTCPGCNTVINRFDGCAHIKCEAVILIDGIQQICGAQWCWICRCFRTREFGLYHHYCLTNDEIAKNNEPNYFPRWTSNPNWISNKNDWKKQTKIKFLNRDPVDGSDLVV